MEILSSVLKKCYGFEVELFHPQYETGYPTTKRVLENLQSHIDKHDHDDSLLIFCYSGEARISQSSNEILALPYANCPDSFNTTQVDKYLHDNVKSDVLRIVDCEHAATLNSERSTTGNAKTDKSKSNIKDRIFKLITSNDRATLFERVIGRLINRAGSAFTINDLKHDLQDVDPNSARSSTRRRSTAGTSQGKAIPPKQETQQGQSPP